MLVENQQAVSYRHARAVIDLAEGHDLPPDAMNFELLSAHVAGENPALCRDVERALQKPPTERAVALHQIYDAYFGNPDVSDGLERLRSGLSTELGDVSASLARGVDGNLKLAAELRRSLRDLAGMVTREELQLVCRHLVYSGREQLSDTQSLAERLERTQYHLSEMRAELSELREKGARDTLTGLHNSTRYADQLDGFLAARMPFCLALVELDKVRELQIVWGPSVRDNVLRGIGKMLQKQLKGQDMAARVGPHSFALILPETPLDGARTLTESIRERFAKVTWVSQSTDQEIGQQTLSIGVTQCSETDDSVSVQARAEGCLTAAKEAGGNAVLLSAPRP